MPKLKTHKGLLKRLTISSRGKARFKHARSTHLRSKKGGKKIRELRRKVPVSPADVKRLEKMLHQRLVRQA